MKKTGGQRGVLDNYRVVALACGAGVALVAAVLFAAALVISSVDFPQSGIAPVAILASVIGCFGAGFLCARMTQSAGLLYGLLCGSIIFLLCLVCEVAFLGGGLGVLALYKYAICAISGMIGGVLGVNKRRKLH